MTQLLKSKRLGKAGAVLVELYCVDGRYIIAGGDSYLSGWLPNEFSMIDAIECFEQVTIQFLNSVGEA